MCLSPSSLFLSLPRSTCTVFLMHVFPLLCVSVAYSTRSLICLAFFCVFCILYRFIGLCVYMCVHQVSTETPSCCCFFMVRAAAVCCRCHFVVCRLSITSSDVYFLCVLDTCNWPTPKLTSAKSATKQTRRKRQKQKKTIGEKINNNNDNITTKIAQKAGWRRLLHIYTHQRSLNTYSNNNNSSRNKNSQQKAKAARHKNL